ncbi:MAG: hypothetical protein KDK04_23580 [Candidatus Competibacteraceae bacterium]|nr:hypothetical protein [Candidatus Competibacteraceae bacterium]
MSPKRKSLAAGMSGSSPVKTERQHIDTPITDPPARTLGRAPSRVGKKPVTAFLSPEAAAQLKAMAALEQTTQEALLIEAINDLFQKRGKPQIA